MIKKILRGMVPVCIFLLGFVVIHFAGLYWSDISELFFAFTSDISLNWYIYLVNLFAFSIGITILISAHEFGHMWVAKQFNVFVIEYSIGMGPCLFSRIWGETKYSIRLLPFGGFVKLAGHYGQYARNDDRDFDRQASWKKLLVMVAGVFVNFILAFILFTGQYYVGTNEFSMIQAGTTIGRIAANSPEEQSGLQLFDTIVSVNGNTVHTWTDVSSEYLVNSKTHKNDLIINRDGVLQNIIVPVKRDKIGNAILQMSATYTLDVAEVTQGSLFGRAGFVKFDRIISINGVAGIYQRTGIDYLVSIYSGKVAIPITVIREGMLVELVLPTYATENPNFGVGFSPYVKYDLQHSAYESLMYMFDILKLNTEVVTATVTADISPEKTFVSPFGIANMAGQAYRAGWQTALFLLGLVSFALGFMNLLPLPVLDGGHVVFLTIESMIGKELPLKFKIKAINFSAILLLLLLAYLVFYDIYFLFI